MIYTKCCKQMREPLTSLDGDKLELICPVCHLKMGSVNLPVLETAPITFKAIVPVRVEEVPEPVKEVEAPIVPVESVESVAIVEVKADDESKPVVKKKPSKSKKYVSD